MPDFMRRDDPDMGAAPRSGRRADDDPEDLETGGRHWPRGRSWPPGMFSGHEGQDQEEEAEGYSEEPVPFATLPKAVRDAVQEQCPGAGGFDAIRLTQGEHIAYNVLARRGRVEMAVTVSPVGDVMEFELDVAPSRLPKSVRATLEREFGSVEFDRVTTVTMHFFELQYEDQDGFRRILQIDASGKVLADLEDDRFTEEDDEQ